MGCESRFNSSLVVSVGMGVKGRGGSGVDEAGVCGVCESEGGGAGEWGGSCGEPCLIFGWFSLLSPCCFTAG